ncbi:MAG TPA: hypothetical protein VMG41_00830 [Gemmatimonadales bacterium]|nr:hypothetical protein [Gemmatimonadales bacterium]
MTGTRLRLVRWRATAPLLLFVVALVVLWVLFADALARRAAVATLSDALGTEVDIGSVRIHLAQARVEVGALAIADPRDSTRDAFEAGTMVFDLDPVPLLEKKFVVDELRLSGLRFGVVRQKPARAAKPGSSSAQLLHETEQWATDKFHYPTLALGRVDSVKALVLHPDQLGTIKAVRALAARSDSLKSGFEQSLARLNLAPLIDSSNALAARLSKADPRQLGLAGVKDAVTSAQQGIARIKQAQQDLATLDRTTRASVLALQQGLADIDAARQRDYAMARGLLDLPSFDAPDIGAALFGRKSIDYFQHAVYAARLIQRYVPPGLQPWNRPGPTRTRMAGTTVEFPKVAQYPGFLLRKGEVDLTAGNARQNQLRADLSGVTSAPALYGHPATLVASGRLIGTDTITVDLHGLSRHFGSAPKDSVVAQVNGVTLAPISFASLPFTLHPGRSSVGFRFALAGDSLAGAWDVTADRASWSADSGGAQPQSVVQQAVWQAVSGLSDLRIHAQLGGTVDAPTLAVSSNLDDAVAARLKALAGQAIAAGEQRARSAVDSLVDAPVQQLKGSVGGVASEVSSRLPGAQGQLQSAQRQLEAAIQRLAGPAGGIKLPKF